MVDIRYYWKEVTKDGLVKTPYYGDHDYNNFCQINKPFYSEQEAMEAFSRWAEEDFIEPKYILIKVYGNDPSWNDINE